MDVTIVTGSGGLVGSSAVLRFAGRDDVVVGIDNDMRGELFGPAGSVADTVTFLENRLDDRYEHWAIDVRDESAVDRVLRKYGDDVRAVIHAAAQPSHDWAAGDPRTDFSINAAGTLNLLEATRAHAENAAFVLLSTNKVYGDRPNRLPFVERSTRWELPEDHPLHSGIDEDFGIDQCVHSLFGASKLSADVLAQEYGRYYGMSTGVFRAGCVTGGRHAGVKQHGFLSHLVRTVVRGETYTVIGHAGKQVRDNVHGDDLAEAMAAFVSDPNPAEVYNLGGGRRCNCSLVEALSHVEDVLSRSANTEYRSSPRKGDHRWYISDCSKFREDYPGWAPEYGMDAIIEELVEAALREERTSEEGI